jgi:guanylate kinase
VRVTTRTQRPSDDPEECIYVTLPEFRRLDQEGMFTSSNEKHGFFHAALKSSVDEVCQPGRLTVADVSVYSAEHIWRYVLSQGYKLSMRCAYLDLQDDRIAEKRLRERSESEESIKRRLVEGRSLPEEIQRSALFFKTIDATQSKADVLEQALAYFMNS